MMQHDSQTIRRRSAWQYLLAIAVSVGCKIFLASWVHAASLADQLDGLIRQEGFQSVDLEVPTLIQTIFRGVDFPTVPATADFTYRYDPESDAFERIARSMGPVFLEPTRTVGRGAFEVGLSFLYADFTERDGNDLPGTEPRFRLLITDPDGVIPLEGRLVFTQFDLEARVLWVSGTYGLTDRWDVNVIVPAVWTSLRVQACQEVDVDGFTVPFGTARIDDDKFGVGDVQLRTKYRFTDGTGFGAAAGLALSVPTGDEDNFQGIGDTTVTPFLSVAREFGPHDIYFNVGVETNVDDVERTQVRYGIGGAVYVLEGLTAVAEVVGRSGVTDDDFTVQRQEPTTSIPPSFPFPGGSPTPVFESPTKGSVPRMDIVDFGFSLKGRLYKRLVGFAGVLVPLTSDGIRADAVPVAGIEATF